MDNTSTNKPVFLSLLLLLAYMVIIFVISVRPAPAGVPSFWQMDKFLHAVIYGIMALLALRVTARVLPFNASRAKLAGFVISFIFGALMEVVQAFISFREGSFYDCVANGVGAFLVIYLAGGFIVARANTD